MNLSRRDFLKGTAAGLAGTALTGLLGACQPASSQETSLPGTSLPETALAETSLAETAAASETQPVSPAGAQPEAAAAPEHTGTLLGDLLNPQDESFTNYTTNYSHIFSPLKIGGVTLKNRIVKSTAGSETQKTTEWPDDASLNYYRQFCKGGVGMVCFETSSIIPMAGPMGLAGGMPAGMPGGLSDGASAGMPGGSPDGSSAGMPGGGSPGEGDMAMGDAMGGFSMASLDFTSDAGIPAHKAVADAMHELDTPVIAQMYDMMMVSGSSSSFLETTALESSFSNGHMQTTEEVQTEIRYFIDGAERYYKAGFDGIELNASCNHYFSTFLSRRANNERTDQYSGASIENRCRILTEIIEGIRQRVGEDFIIQVLFSAVEENVAELGRNEGCTTIEEAVEFAKLFEKAGASCLHIRSEAYGHHCGGFMPDILHVPEHGHTGYGTVMDYGKHMPPVLGQYDGVAALLEAAAQIKQNVSIPVGAVGSMDPRLAPDLLDNAIAEGKLDFLLMTRPLMADFALANKLKENRRDEVAPCTHCMTCFVAPIDMGTPMYCRVNAALTRAYGADMPEGYAPLPAETPKNVMVIGGGPAGMEAARIAASRGHHVTLYEKSPALGGRMEALQKLKGPHERILDHKAYLERQLEVYHVQVVTGQEITADFVQQKAPDSVIVAVGSLPGELGAQAQASEPLLTMSDILSALGKGEELPSEEEIILVGAQFQAGELAVRLCKAGKKVTMLNPGPEKEFFMNAATWPREMNRSWLRAKGVRLYHNVSLKQIAPRQAVFDTEYGVAITLDHGRVIQALPESTNRALYEALLPLCNEVYAVGDCYSPGTMANGIARANIIARRIGSTTTTPQAGPADGNTYTATATGIGDVTVTIQVEDGKVTDAVVDTSNESAGIGRELGEAFAKQIIETGSIDAVSSATVTSNAVSKALAECKKQAELP